MQKIQETNSAVELVHSWERTVLGRVVRYRWVPVCRSAGRTYGRMLRLAGVVFAVVGLSREAMATGFTPIYDPTAISTYCSSIFTSALVPLVAGIVVFFWFLRLLRRAK